MPTHRPILARRLLAAASSCALLTGCQTPKAVREGHAAVIDYFDGDYPAAAAKLEPIAKEPDENYVLNNLRLGSTALASYDLNTAESAFLNAWQVINAGGTNSGGRSVAAVVVDEKLKVWKGEPYERAMASFDLGLVYLLRNDYNNARAGFENALFKLRDYADASDEKKGYKDQESTFVLADILLGRCWQRLGRDDQARRAFDDAAKLRPDLAALADPNLHAHTNVLLVVDYGYGPRKRSQYDGTAVAFVPTPRTAGLLPHPQVTVDGRFYDLGQTGRGTVDTVAMAQDRRWQSIDTIRVSKDVVGTGLIAAGAGYGLYRLNDGRFNGVDAAIVGGAIAAGALLRAGSDVDTRQWEMVPRTVYLLPLSLPPGKHDVAVVFPETAVAQTWRGLDVPPTGDLTAYFRMNRFATEPFGRPPTLTPGPPVGVGRGFSATAELQ